MKIDPLLWWGERTREPRLWVSHAQRLVRTLAPPIAPNHVHFHSSDHPLRAPRTIKISQWWGRESTWNVASLASRDHSRRMYSGSSVAYDFFRRGAPISRMAYSMPKLLLYARQTAHSSRWRRHSRRRHL